MCVNAGASRTGLRFAATGADYLFSGARNAQLFQQITMEAGRDVGIIGTTSVFLRPTRHEAQDLASAVVAHADRRSIRSMMIAGGADTPESAEAKLADPDFMRRRFLDGAIIGSPDDVAEGLADRAAGGGFAGICLTLFDYLRDLELFGRRVLPILQERLQERQLALQLSTDAPSDAAVAPHLSADA